MATILKRRGSFANITARIANFGESFAFGVACLLFALMLVVLIADLVFTIGRYW
jgi:hypothetical protein